MASLWTHDVVIVPNIMRARVMYDGPGSYAYSPHCNMGNITCGSLYLSGEMEVRMV